MESFFSIYTQIKCHCAKINLLGYLLRLEFCIPVSDLSVNRISIRFAYKLKIAVEKLTFSLKSLSRAYKPNSDLE